VQLLGHIVGSKQLTTDPAKVAAVKQLKPPRTVKELMGFLGFTGFYRRLIPHYAKHGKVLA
jgi:hypothetical protein